MFRRKLVAVIGILLMFAAFLPPVEFAEAAFENQALGKPVGVTSALDTDPTGDKVVDGSPGGGQDTSTGIGRSTRDIFVGDAFFIDLEIPQVINETRFLWVTHTLSNMKFGISYSSDNATWTQVVQENSTNKVAGSVTWHNSSFTDVTARYWKWEKLFDSKSYATNDPLRELELWGEPVELDLSITVTNFDQGNWLFADSKFYIFRGVAQSTNSSIDTMQFRFNDTNTNVQVTYDNVTGITTLDSGDDVITLGTPSATSTFENQIWNLTVTFPVWLKGTIFDAQDVDVDMQGNSTEGKSQSWFAAQEDYFNIYNHGGLSVINSTGTAGRIVGGDVFEIQASNLTSVQVNQTWAMLQHYHTQFSIRFSDDTVGEDQYMQDSAHDGGVDKSSDKGDWLLEVGFYYFDDVVDAWVKGWHVLLQMEEGDQGENDMWITLNATWFRNDVKIKSDNITAFLEQEPAAKFRIWVDLWFNTQNNSQLHGGRVQSYFHGMEGNFFAAWAPLKELTESFYTHLNLNNASEVISAQEIGLMKIYYNLTRPATQAGELNFTTTLTEFDINEKKFARGVMTGVSTPLKADVKVPEVGQVGFLTPLYAAISSIGTFIIDSLTNVANIGWQAINDRFPWFTQFWEDALNLVIAFAQFLSTLAGYLIGLLNFMFSILEFAALPLTIPWQAWVLLEGTYVELFGATNIGSVASAALIIIITISLMEAIYSNDWPFLIKVAKQMWAIANAILLWTFRLIKVISDIVLGVIPF